MKIKLLIILVLIFSNAIYSSAYAVVAGGMAVVHRNWPVIPGGYNSMEFTITITAEPGFNGRTFWAHEWGFIGKREGGYLGLQSRNANIKAVNFSIWGALGWQAAQGTHCRFFTHEGSGVQCDLEYQWEEGVTYKLRVNNSANNAWTATIHDTKRNQIRTIATINVPPSYSGVYRLAEWVENFAQGSEQHPSCDVVPKAIAVFGTPTVNNSIPPTGSITYTYGNCQRIARSVCSTEQICTLSVNPEPPTIRKQLRNATHGFCLDLLGGGTAAGLWQCSPNNNQIFSQDASYHLRQTSNPTQCLSSGINNSVITTACNNSARQQWLRVNRTSAYFNAGTGKCLHALNNGQQNSLTNVYQCNETNTQRWMPIP